MKDTIFFKQAELLLRILPLIYKEEVFALDEIRRILSSYDLYAGKICAALDRQHPRDLFDVHLLLENEGIKTELRKAFIVYLISHPRLMVEILNPQKIDISGIFEKEFKGMIAQSITLEELETTRDKLVTILREELTPNQT